jgi:hypothetical protein
MLGFYARFELLEGSLGRLALLEFDVAACGGLEGVMDFLVDRLA